MLSWWNGIHSGLRYHRLKCLKSSNLLESTRFNNYGGLAERSMALVLKTIGFKSSESSNLSPASKFKKSNMLFWWNGIHGGLRNHWPKGLESSSLSESTRFKVSRCVGRAVYRACLESKRIPIGVPRVRISHAPPI